MSLEEIKTAVLNLSAEEKHDLIVFVNRMEWDYGDVPGEALAQRTGGSLR